LSQLNMDTFLDIEGDEVDLIQGKILNNVVEKLSAREIAALRRIDIALDKIETGQFGICEECGENISDKRLMAHPEASTCITCAEELERIEKQYASG
jgi:DnaK suppressor protein